MGRNPAIKPCCSYWCTCRSSCDSSRRVLCPRQMKIAYPRVSPTIPGPINPAWTAAACRSASSGIGSLSPTISTRTRSGLATPTARAISSSEAFSGVPTAAALAARSSAHAIARGSSLGKSMREGASDGRYGLVSRASQELRHRGPGARFRQPFVRVIFDADGIRREMRPFHEGIGVLVRGKAVNLKLHLVAIGIGVVHRDRDAVVNAPIRFDALRLQLRIVL